MERKAKRIAQLLKTLANENRLAIFRALMEHPMTASQIAEKVPSLTQPALSRHLALLKANGILNRIDPDPNACYYIADRKTEDVVNVLKQYY